MLRKMLWLMLLSGSVSADVFKCVTDQGAVSFRDTPCDQRGVRVPVQSLSSPEGGLRESERRWLQERTRRSSKKAPARQRRTKKDPQVQAQRCWRKRQQLDRVRAKLRRGYKPAQGERLRRQRKTYEAYLFRYCG